MSRVWQQIALALERDGRCALVSVVSTQGSAPRDAGAHMVVTPMGYHGTIGGGTLEWQAMAQAQALMERGPAARLTAHALGPDMGQCCGGRVTLMTEAFSSTQLDEAQALAAREAEGDLDLTRNGVTLKFGGSTRAILLFGAGHVGRALVMALAPLPCAVRWVDPRPNAFPAAVPSNVTLSAADPVREATEAEKGSFAFIMSHSHALDLAITDAALRNGAIAHTGLIGSATKRARFEHRLKAAGVPDHRVAALICPIGVPGIAGKEPAVIAAATAAQILVLDEALRLASADNPLHHVALQEGAKR
ncbi:xanthine dehydrogenase accessory protein XdhC [Aestuariivirga sp.]|uniref:xanthine dehydrogenase accessory protein XdhC n=1 Tax=Aestuariivirga sp. TaxID=2650926 RepID=UPI0039E6E785